MHSAACKFCFSGSKEVDEKVQCLSKKQACGQEAECIKKITDAMQGEAKKIIEKYQEDKNWCFLESIKSVGCPYPKIRTEICHGEKMHSAACKFCFSGSKEVDEKVQCLSKKQACGQEAECIKKITDAMQGEAKKIIDASA